jgi:hypothetical protein
VSQDIVFFLIEGYDVAECRRLEKMVIPHYHNELARNLPCLPQLPHLPHLSSLP